MSYLDKLTLVKTAPPTQGELDAVALLDDVYFDLLQGGVVTDAKPEIVKEVKRKKRKKYRWKKRKLRKDRGKKRGKMTTYGNRDRTDSQPLVIIRRMNVHEPVYGYCNDKTPNHNWATLHNDGSYPENVAHQRCMECGKTRKVISRPLNHTGVKGRPRKKSLT